MCALAGGCSMTRDGSDVALRFARKPRPQSPATRFSATADGGTARVGESAHKEMADRRRL
jgi:hypothetical protein